jgi:hypothetical protein
MILLVNAGGEEYLCDEIRNSQAFQDGIGQRDFSMEVTDTYGILKSPTARHRVASAFTEEKSDTHAHLEECSATSQPPMRFGNTRWKLIVRRGNLKPGPAADPDSEDVERICTLVKSNTSYRSWLNFDLRLDSSAYGCMETETVRRKIEVTLSANGDKCTITPIRQSLEEAEMESTGKWSLTIERPYKNV